GDRPGPAHRAHRPLRRVAARRERDQHGERRQDAADDHARAAVRLRRLRRELPGRPARLLDHDELLDQRAAARRPAAALAAGDPRRGRPGERRARACGRLEGDGGRRARRERRSAEGPAAPAAQEEEAVRPEAVTMAEERERRVEAEGGSPGEAKWAAMKELERRFPGITADAVTFEVLEVGDGEEGRVRVAATVDVEAWKAQAEAFPGEPS